MGIRKRLCAMRQFLRARGKFILQSKRYEPPLTRFGKRFAVRMDDFDRSIISASLTKDELKNAFKMLDENNDGTIDVRELARLFVYDPTACEKFIGHGERIILMKEHYVFS